MNKKKHILLIAVISFFVISATIGLIFPGVLINTVNKSYEEDAKPYFSENMELKESIGEIKTYQCLGRASKRDEEGLPVYFEVKGEKGDFYVTLWFEIISFDPDEYKIVKHLVTTIKPENS